MRNVYFLLLLIVLFLIPLNIFIIGDFIGVGIQWILFNYQVSSYGSGLITIFNNFYYITQGTIAGRSALSLLFWIIGGLASIFNLVYFYLDREKEEIFLYASIITLTSAFAFLTSIIIQYGPLFHGPAGVAIPVGLPLLFFLSYWFYSLHRKNREGCQEE